MLGKLGELFLVFSDPDKFRAGKFDWPFIGRFDRHHRIVQAIANKVQNLNEYPSRKYEGAAYHDIASVLAAAVSTKAALDFVRRLALAALTGNGDMHLKNWSLIYRGDGFKPELAPLYDVLSSIPYIPADRMALSLGGERSFKALNAQRWKIFANRARLPEPAVLKAVVEIVERVNACWWSLQERVEVPVNVLQRIDAHVKMMMPILSTCDK